MIVHRNQPPNRPQPPQNEYTKGNGIFAVGLVMLLLMCSIGVWGLKGRGLLGSRGKEKPQNSLQSSAGGGEPSLLASESGAQGNILASVGANGEPVLESKAPTNTAMPDDVREWLDHLRRAEEKREEIATKQVTEAIGMLTELKSAGGGMDLSSIMEGGEGDGQPQAQAKDPQAPGRVVGSANDMKSDWRRLIQAFDAKPAPAECAEMKEQYDRVLNETGNMIEEIVSVVQNIGDDPMGAIGKLEGMQGKSTGRIDSFARNVDQGVASICSKYDTPKWFSVKTDFGGGGSMLMSLGL
jgi:hypothetical protein